MPKFFTFLPFFLLFYASATAQTYNFIEYTVEDGVEQVDILDINQTRNGRLLYGTNGGGLGIYDGYNFESLKEKQGLANNVVFSIAIDSKDSIWCATNSGVSRVDPQLTEVSKNYLEGKAVYVAYSQQDKVLFGSAQGLYTYDGQLDSIVKKDFNAKVDSAWITDIFIDSGQNLWLGTKNSGLFKIEDEKQVSQFSRENTELSNNYIKTIIEGKNNDIFIGTIHDLYLIKNNKLSGLNIASDEEGYLTLTDAVVHEDRLVFGALNKRLYFVDLEDYSTDYYAQENGFDYKRVWSVFNDKEGNLWLGTIGNGLVRYISTFSFFDKRSGLKNTFIDAVYHRDDKIYLANRAALQVIQNSEIIKTIPFDDKAAFNYIYDITAIDGELYLSSNKGLFKLDGEQFVAIPVNNAKLGVTEKDIYTSFQHQNTSYFGGKSGLYRFEDDSLSIVKHAPRETIYNIIEFQGAFYLASEEGVYKFNADAYRFITEEDGLNCTRARSFFVDNELLWIGTNNGVFLYDGSEIIHHFSSQEGLSSENIYFLSKDNNRHVWAGSNKGVDKISIASVYRSMKDTTQKVEITNYDKSRGFSGVECNMNAVDILNDKKMLFGTVNGLFIYNREKDSKNELPPILSLNNIKLNFTDVDWSRYGKMQDNKLPQDLTLTYKNNNLIFEYVGISLSNPEAVIYQYKLEGLDDHWLPITSDHKAVYTAIPPGNYTFMLRARNADKVWTAQPLRFSFVITPPWWQTTWFYISAVIAALLGFYFIMDYRTRMLRKEQRLLSQKVDERTKELREEKEKVEHANSKLEKQNEVIEIANKNITDSINYAQKIQEAVLPKASKLKIIADALAILYIPKDVVSGDFYWFDTIDNKLVFAAADCTGHGVPGAFMSMIGINNLNQIILEEKTTRPDLVLKEMNNSIKKALKQDDKDSQSRDGMDIVLICVDYKSNTLTYAGAYRPLVFIRDHEIHEIKASRRAIGGDTPIDFNYELHSMTIQEGDVFYLYSDGYPDQFGGSKGKKLMTKKLKRKFVEIHQKNPEEQREVLLKDFYDWKGEEEQVDDILVAILKF